MLGADVPDHGSVVTPRQGAGRAASFDEADAHLEAVLEQLEAAENYKAWILELVAPYVRGHVLELGAGRGTYSRELREMGTALTAIEPSGSAAAHLRRQLAGVPGVAIVEGVLEGDLVRGYDTAVMLNVLEHIEHDALVVQHLYDGMEPGGHVVVWVPAFPLLYGRFDRQVGHHRRYRRATLVRMLEDAGFEMVQCRHVNLPGWFAWLAVVRVLRSHPTSGGLSHLYDRWFVPVTRSVERRVRAPFGQSILAVGRRGGVPTLGA